MLAGERCARPIKGVIGLHSTLSDGKATPEALIAQAKASGFNGWSSRRSLRLSPTRSGRSEPSQARTFASAGERHETKSPDKWEQLRKICKAASTEDFAVLPGLDYADNTGDRWVVFGDFKWPPEKVFSPDKKKIIDPKWWWSIGWLPNGPYNAGKNHLRPWDYSQYNLWPVRTTMAGKQVDKRLGGFPLRARE